MASELRRGTIQGRKGTSFLTRAAQTADDAILPAPLLWTARIAVPLAAILIPAGFFLSMLPPTATQPSSAVGLIYAVP
ncbi:MAG: hypothetical protein ACYDDS_18025 [Candidatus Sulfotelmatobacter sp.]